MLATSEKFKPYLVCLACIQETFQCGVHSSLIHGFPFSNAKLLPNKPSHRFFRLFPVSVPPDSLSRQILASNIFPPSHSHLPHVWLLQGQRSWPLPATPEREEFTGLTSHPLWRPEDNVPCTVPSVLSPKIRLPKSWPLCFPSVSSLASFLACSEIR